MRLYEKQKETGIIRSGVYRDDVTLPPRIQSTTGTTEKKVADDEIENEWYKPSENWVEAGSGNVGKLYVEILGCDGLENKDIDIMGNTSDPFVCITFEDTVVNTDVINDSLTPRWMPWSQRAFVFNVMHPSSQLYIAVMDHDGGVKSSHDKLGRCVINPSNARTHTVYYYSFDLLDNDSFNRKVTGKIKLRFRFECTNHRQYLLSAFQARKEYRVSTDLYADSQVMSFAVTNDVSI